MTTLEERLVDVSTAVCAILRNDDKISVDSKVGTGHLVDKTIPVKDHLGRQTIALIDTHYTHAIVRFREINTIVANFAYEDPAPGDIREIVFDAVPGGEREIAMSIANEMR